jgi:tetratricopeptide (TPR) repeat protein
MTSIHFSLCAIVVVTVIAPIRALSEEKLAGGIVYGHVRDSGGLAVANASVFLQISGAGRPLTPEQVVRTDSSGAFRFSELPQGTYTLRAEKAGYDKAIADPLNLGQSEMRELDLTLVPLVSPQPSEPTVPAHAPATKATASTPEFFDEPRFTVAGVTEGTNSGGHGSDTVVRSAEALAKATVSLSHETGKETEPAMGASESALRAELARSPNDPARHHQLAEVEEKSGNPLEAVRDFQRAAELDPNEQFVFDWGVELLTHRALEPASQVFAKGNHLFPESVRMLIALGVTDYARGDYEQAAQNLAKASDLAPENPTPYLFLGRMQSVVATLPEDSAVKLRRFAELQPENPLANYYYAVSLSREIVNSAESEKERLDRMEALLRKALHLDPRFGAVYLQLGILYAQRVDYARAISAYQKAIEVTPENHELENDETLEQSHYRLAQAYLRTGEKVKGQEELKIHERLSKMAKEDSARERREIRDFVISMRDGEGELSPKK